MKSISTLLRKRAVFILGTLLLLIGLGTSCMVKYGVIDVEWPDDPSQSDTINPLDSIICLYGVLPIEYQPED